ncbi:hypothetical protein CEXT_169711 [Caerostris extrusa]|uniref:Uncharacterized protein n=1 Tax=Caerostris extrusa TaxID=172846 RepID=A0AAV4XJ52_CAEEX|nr:hypothetical protein CEXT_169711 [Caerostris extrusa]
MIATNVVSQNMLDAPYSNDDQTELKTGKPPRNRDSNWNRTGMADCSFCLLNPVITGSRALFVFGVRSLMNLFTKHTHTYTRTLKGSIIFQQVHRQPPYTCHSEYLRKRANCVLNAFKELGEGMVWVVSPPQRTLISDLAVSLNGGVWEQRNV